MRWSSRLASFPALACVVALTFGCASTDDSSSAATTTSATSSTTGSGGGGGATSATTTSSSASSASSTTTSSSSGGGQGGEGGSTATGTGGQGGGAGGAGGAGGEGGAGGAGGQGGGLVGTPEYPVESESNDLKQLANPLAVGTKGFTAALSPLGDIDVFAVDVSIPGTSLRVETSDGLGGCPAGASTLVKVSGPSGFLASDNGSGSGNCSLLTAQAYSGLSNLAAGTYYVQVESILLQAISSYVLDIQLIAPGCGDGLIQLSAGEQCDDGALVPGDGCDDLCQLENPNGAYLTEVEPNQPQSSAQPLGAAPGVVGAISPAGDQDYFAFDVPVNGTSATILVSDGLGGCPAGLDTKLYAFDAASTQIGYDDDSGAGNCSMITLSNLGAGTYAFRVEEYGNDGVAPFYVVTVDLTAPFCGDGLQQANEACDDGNNLDNDGCSAVCSPEAVTIAEVEPNGTLGLAQNVGLAVGVIGAIQPVADKDIFAFDVPVASSSVVLNISDGAGGCPAFDSILTFYNPLGQVIATNDQGDVPPCSTLKPSLTPAMSNLAAGTYKVKVEESGNNAIVPLYHLSITVTPPSCGDGVIQAGEVCDDGNPMDGDGCSSMCAVEANMSTELELNDSLASANSTTGYLGVIAAITPVGDKDYFSFSVPSAGLTATIQVRNWVGGCPIGLDTIAYLYDPMGVQIALNDDANGTSCSAITQSGLAMGTYTVRIEDNGNNSTAPFYLLTVGLQ
jgi:cysteine-rich repeat protein